MEPHFLTVGQAAKRLNVSESTIRNYERQGKLPAIRVGAAHDRLLDRDAVEQMAQEREQALAERTPRG